MRSRAPVKSKGSSSSKLRAVLASLALLSEDNQYDVGHFHRPQSKSHLDALSASDLAAELHHRLHISPSLLSDLPNLASDIPSRVAKVAGAPCTHCLEAVSYTHLTLPTKA